MNRRRRAAVCTWLLAAYASAACGGGGAGKAVAGASGVVDVDNAAAAGGAGAKAAAGATSAGEGAGASAASSGSGSGRGAGAAGSATSQAGTAPAVAGRGMPAAGGSGAGGLQAGRGAAGTAGSAAACDICAAYAAPMQSGTIETTELEALSGLAVSRSQTDVVFAHNDHDRAVVYALDSQGRTHLRVTLEAAMATDIEDIALGPCEAQTCVYLGDIGDNAATRNEYAILRFAEPSVPNAPGSTSMSIAFQRYRFRYEDGSHNAESLMVGPDGTLYVVTKLAPGSGGRVAANGPSSVYRLPQPLSADKVATATKLVTLPIPATGDQAASAAAAHPCGLGFLVRTYNRVYEFRAPKTGKFEDAFSAMPSAVAMPNEPQSEGIDYRADGRGFVTSGEGTHAPLFVTGCQ